MGIKVAEAQRGYLEPLSASNNRSRMIAALKRVDEQAVFRSTHMVAADQQLSSAELDKLRTWASVRMRELPFAVFEQDSGEMRASFVNALRHAAASLTRGEVPA